MEEEEEETEEQEGEEKEEEEEEDKEKERGGCGVGKAGREYSKEKQRRPGRERGIKGGGWVVEEEGNKEGMRSTSDGAVDQARVK